MAVRLSEQTHALAALHLKATFMILDVARTSPFFLSGQPPASGLAWVEPESNMLIAFNAAPGTVSPNVGDGYGPYARALAEMIREGGLTSDDVFVSVSLRVNELTKGTQVPWYASRIETKLMFLQRSPGAPPGSYSPEHAAWMRSQPMRSLGARDAYLVALMRDTFDAYADFLADYWRDPMTKRVRALLAARRETMTWRRTYQANVPDAYWSYLERYPRGFHVADAGRLLTLLGAAIAPPPKFARMEYDIPPPLPDELEYLERRVLVFDDPAFAFESPQPLPSYVLAPPEFLPLAPAAPSGVYDLPAPMFVPLPVYVDVPTHVVVPPNSLVFNNAAKKPDINNANGVPTKPDGETVTSSISPPNVHNVSDSPRLPPSVLIRATLNISRSLPPPASNPVPREEIEEPPSAPVPVVSLAPFWATLDAAAQAGIKAPLSHPLPTLSSRPFWPINNNIPASSGIESPVRTTENAEPIVFPTMLAPLPTAMQLQTRRTAMLLPWATGSIPLPVPRPATFAPPPTRNRPKPISASMFSPTGVDQAEQPSAPLLRRLAPSTHLARPPKVALGVSPPKPQRKPCLIVDGRRMCS
jgi:uncharacterized caspase-like protein